MGPVLELGCDCLLSFSFWPDLLGEESVCTGPNRRTSAGPEIPLASLQKTELHSIACGVRIVILLGHTSIATRAQLTDRQAC